MQFALDAASAAALIKASVEMESTKIVAECSASAGLMGPSATVVFTSREVGLCGWVFKFTIDGSAGIGIKVEESAGVTVDLNQAKLSAHQRFGFFPIAGLSGGAKVEVSPNFELVEVMSTYYQEQLAADPIMQQIVEKMQSKKLCNSWEIDYFDSFTSQVAARGQVQTMLK